MNTAIEKRLKNGANNNSRNNSPGIKYEMDDEDTDSEEVIPKQKCGSKNSDSKCDVSNTNKPTNASQNAQMKNKVKPDTDSQPKAKIGKFETSDTDDENTLLSKDDVKLEDVKPIKTELTAQNTSKKKEVAKKDVKPCEKKSNLCDKNKLVKQSSPKTSGVQEIVSNGNIFSSQQNSCLDVKQLPKTKTVSNPANEQNNLLENQINGFVSKQNQNDQANKSVKVDQENSVSSNPLKQIHQMQPQNILTNQNSDLSLITNSIFNHQINSNKFNIQNVCQSKINNNQKYMPSNLCQQVGKNIIHTPVPQNCNKLSIQQVQIITCYNEQLVTGQHNKIQQDVEQPCATSKNGSLVEEDKRILESKETGRVLTNSNCVRDAKFSVEKPLFQNIFDNQTITKVVTSQNSWNEAVNLSSVSTRKISDKPEVQQVPDIKSENVNFQETPNKISNENQSYFIREINQETGKYTIHYFLRVNSKQTTW